MSNKKILGLVGSPNRDGLTNRFVGRTLEAAEKAGAKTELVQMSDCVVDACKDCLPWVCRENRKCTYPDEAFEKLAEMLYECGGLVWGVPVYWGDTSMMVRLAMQKLYRCFAASQPFSGKPAFGIAVAGGTGNGLVTGLYPLYHFFRIMWMRAIEPLPITRFNFEAAEEQAVPEKERFKIKGSLAKADILAASGFAIEAMNETSLVIDSASEIFHRGQ
jgi:multimeric flavodoxin WrbA